MNLYKSWSTMLMILAISSLSVGIFTLKKEWALIFQFSFIQIESCKMEMILILDWISLIFSSAVLFISSAVIKFSEEYMEEENFKLRFLFMVLLFILSMLLLILSPNMMSILLGWDGLGLVSYCLIIYYQNPRSYNAGMLTILSNRIGDVLILLSIALLLSSGTWNILTLNLSETPKTILLLILIAAMTKSAQIPFSAWLPAAMAAPTPVSSLVHSSTLVTAGVFLMIRFHKTFHTNLLSYTLLISSSITMLLAGIAATLETDTKKVIALSTLSQLAIMMMAISLNLHLLAYFHMITHAMFKALLFLCAGFLIHNMKNNQDIRKTAPMIFSSPTISTSMFLSSLALMGFPFLAGFYSKDLILEQSMKSLFFLFIMIIILISFGMTMIYSIRLPFFSFLSKYYFSKSIYVQENPMMESSIFTLTIMAISTGALLGWLILPSPPFSLIPILPKSMGMILILTGALVSVSIWIMSPSISYTKSMKKTFLGSMWFMPSLSTFPFSKNLLSLSLTKSAEMGWNELLGPQGIYKSILITSSKLSKIQMNQIQMFLLSFILTLFILMIFYPT